MLLLGLFLMWFAYRIAGGILLWTIGVVILGAWVGLRLGRAVA